MNKKLLLSLIPATCLLVTGCTDDNYDLSNIDKTVGISVNNLVVPVNLGTITLNSVFDIDEDNPDRVIFKDVISGEGEDEKSIYVFRKNGTFDSDPIHIAAFNVEPPYMDQTQTLAHLNLNDQHPRTQAPALASVYDIDDTERKFNYHISEIDDKVKTVAAIEANKITFTMDIHIPDDVMSNLRQYAFRNLKIEFPKKLTMSDGTPAKCNLGGTYDPTTGILLIPDYVSTQAHVILTLTSQVMDFTTDKNPDGMILEGNNFDFTEYIRIKSGQLVLTPKTVMDMPTEFDVFADYDMPGFNIDYFSGQIDYNIDGLSFDAVSLDDLPEFLEGDQTKIKIANPQLYITFYNTCWEYNLGGDVSLNIIANRKKGAIDYRMPGSIKVGSKREMYQFAIAADTGNGFQPISDYAGAEKLPFPALSEVLFGSDEKGYGIPQTIDVEFKNPVINGLAKRFPLRQNGEGENGQGTIKAVNGTYTFHAPLALDTESVIIYSGQKDDWDSKDLETLEVDLCQVTADAYSEIPLQVDLSARLLKKEANGEYTRIGTCISQPIAASANGEQVVITIVPDKEHGEEWLTGIDGIYYEATAIATEQYENANEVPALSPQMTLRLENLKIKVNGRYVKDLDD